MGTAPGASFFCQTLLQSLLAPIPGSCNTSSSIPDVLLLRWCLSRSCVTGLAGAELCKTPSSPSHPLQESLFPARVVYDLLFFFIVIIIVLNLIFGVIIDTFADLRSEKQKKEEILKTTCFICGEHWEYRNCPKVPPPLPGCGKENNSAGIWFLFITAKLESVHCGGHCTGKGLNKGTAGGKFKELFLTLLMNPTL